MKRRSFFKSLIGLVLAPLGARTESISFPSWRRSVSKDPRKVERELLEFCNREDEMWRPSSDKPFGIHYWLKGEVAPDDP